MPNEFHGYAQRLPDDSPESLRRALLKLGDVYDVLKITIPQIDQGFAGNPLVTPSAAGVNVPPFCDFTVTGVDGKFLAAITLPQNTQPASVATMQGLIAANPNASLSPIVHLLESATDLNFNATSNVTRYGPSAQLSWEIQDPNQTKFWRLSSSFDGVNFNRTRILGSVLTCGSVGVYSGLLRNSANSLNQAATTASGTNPLTQSGTTTNILVAASIWKCGDQTINYKSGNVDPGSFGTWFVYANDARRAGGTITFIAVNAANQANITADNGNVYFGSITTSSGGGGTGSGGGGGTCCRAGVPYLTADGTLRDCLSLHIGDALRGIDGGLEVIQGIELHPARPCFHLEFDSAGKLTKKQYIGDFTVFEIQLDRTHTFFAGNNNVIDGACSTHTIQYAGGGFTDVFGAVVGESFNLVNGSIGSHNYRKIN